MGGLKDVFENRQIEYVQNMYDNLKNKFKKYLSKNSLVNVVQRSYQRV